MYQLLIQLNMKKYFLFFLIILTGLSGFSQRFKVETSANFLEYKKHYSHSIEGGIVDGQARQFVVGNETDWLTKNQSVKGQSIAGITFVAGQDCHFVPLAADRIQLTDFTIYPTDEFQYGAGTGVYYPTGVTGMGYPYLAIYDKSTMSVLYSYFYTLVYPNGYDPSNTVGVKIIYSSAMDAFYISGVMVDRSFTEINLNNIVGKSKGFIMKIDASNLLAADVLIIEPENLTNDPVICSVHDMELSPDGKFIAFTGITTKKIGDVYYHPMVGLINTQLAVQWSNVYQFDNNRYSGVDVEYNTINGNLFVLMNTSRNPFAVMELRDNGDVYQIPVKFDFYQPGSGIPPVLGSARAHKLHYQNGAIEITGNCFVNSNNPYGDQLLFSYGIPDATSLNSGNNYYTSYSREEVPLGSQKAVTGYWAPENSIYSEGNLSIVGVYNNNNASFGYTLINVGGFINQEGCSETGVVELGHFETTNYQISSYLTECNGISFEIINTIDNPQPTQECPIADPGTKSSANGLNSDGSENLWQYKGIDARGIHAILYSESNNTRYEVVVYDMMGRKITSSSYNVSGGQQEIYLEFAAKAEMYILKVSNGKYTETLKIVSNN
ncbi:MAG: hypothetical protein A2W85_15810 [Bacteroidetes bacterium GWF2_41_31]|nr:MAG: hypothetical protein A2W85_15810 [Bacteroidetes bacterium GWF2_41_31]